MEHKNFITTTDIETKNKLIELGFQQINDTGSRFVFINNSKEFFDDKGKISYTNKICI